MDHKYRSRDEGIVIEGVSADYPMINDNDWWNDVSDAAYLWAKASLGKCKLRGNIITRCTISLEVGYVHLMREQVDDCRKLVMAAQTSGLRNVLRADPGRRRSDPETGERQGGGHQVHEDLIRCDMRLRSFLPALS